MNQKKSVAVILGSAFEGSFAERLDLTPCEINTEFGEITLYKSGLRKDRDVYVLYRHGMPHFLLPNQINYRAQAAALESVNCGALLINSSVGVLDARLPIYKPMLVTDLLMPENRLPDGSTCSVFPEPKESHGHLLLREGLFSKELNAWINERHKDVIFQSKEDIVFVYAGGPRSKTPAENRMWALLGGQINSMTLAPEVVLANELEIPTVAVAVGHKYSVPDKINPEEKLIRQSLVDAREATANILLTFMKKAEPVPYRNQIYRYGDE
jgi:5'-methylthioadenosine phosphorylase